MTLAFLIFYFIFGFIENPDIASYNLTNSTIYFLAAVMLIDPKSSPVKKMDQIFYGIFAAGMIWFLSDADQYVGLLAILATNLAYFIRTRIKLSKKPISDIR
jgi:Na+-translocating ferredoxin:NAD+ oxidoreductase RnfD subunit